MCRFSETYAAHVKVPHVPPLSATLKAAPYDATLEFRDAERPLDNRFLCHILLVGSKAGLT